MAREAGPVPSALRAIIVDPGGTSFRARRLREPRAHNLSSPRPVTGKTWGFERLESPAGCRRQLTDRDGFLTEFLALVACGKENCSPFRKHFNIGKRRRPPRR